MNVLDIDLDFFLDERVTTPLPPVRPSDNDYIPWTTDAVETFLTDCCRLDPNRPLPGAIVTEHHELFAIWKKLISMDQLAIPFNLVHVDAHADMGMGNGSPSYISGNLLHMEVAQRTNPNDLHSGNYVAFAMSCRWIHSFTYVHHPKMRQENLGKHDIPDIFVKDDNHLQFKILPRESVDGIHRYQEYVPLRLEPEIPINLIPGADFATDTGFSFMFVARSPRYTPPSADKLVAILKQFIIPLPC